MWTPTIKRHTLALVLVLGLGGSVVASLLWASSTSITPSSTAVAVASTVNLKAVPSNVAQGTYTNSNTTYAAVTSGFYNLFDGTAADGFLISCATTAQCTSFNLVISATASPTTVVYETCQTSTWTSVTPTTTATWTALGYTQVRGVPTAGWTTGACGTTAAPAGNFNLRVRQTVGTTTVSGRVSLDLAHDVTADQVVMLNGSNTPIFAGSVSVTPDASLAGPAANGRDQAGAFGAASYAYLWLANNGTTTAGFWSASSSASTVRTNIVSTGYTYVTLIGGYRVDANSLVIPWWQVGNIVMYPNSITDLNAGAVGAGSASVTVTVPPIANAVFMNIAGSKGSGTGAECSAAPEPHASPTFPPYYGASFGVTIGGATSILAYGVGPYRVPLKTAQTIYYGIPVGDACSIYTIGYQVPGAIN